VIVVRIPGVAEGHGWRLVREDHARCDVRGCRNPVAQISFDLAREDREAWAFFISGSNCCERHAGRALYAAVGVALPRRYALELAEALPRALREACGGDEALYCAALRALTGANEEGGEGAGGERDGEERGAPRALAS
jgi:hypothetical protein